MDEREPLKIVSQSTDYNRRNYTVVGPVHHYTDREILERCSYTPEFGGQVARVDSGATVSVYTD
jgi:hypothetical protein